MYHIKCDFLKIMNSFNVYSFLFVSLFELLSVEIDTKCGILSVT